MPVLLEKLPSYVKGSPSLYSLGGAKGSWGLFLGLALLFFLYGRVGFSGYAAHAAEEEEESGATAAR